MKFVQLILRKIIKIVTIRCQILRLKCTEFDFGWGSAPDPTGRAYSAPPDPLAVFEGPLLTEWREKGKTEVSKSFKLLRNRLFPIAHVTDTPNLDRKVGEGHSSPLNFLIGDALLQWKLALKL